MPNTIRPNTTVANATMLHATMPNATMPNATLSNITRANAIWAGIIKARTTMSNSVSYPDGISNVRSRIFHHFDDYTEVWGAIVFGILAVMSCAAMAWACNGIL